MIATLIELFNDKDGDFNKGADMFVRLFFFAFEAWMIHFIFDKPVWAAFMLSTAIFFLTFDYLISYILIKNGTLEPPRGVTYHWFTYQAKAGVIDNIGLWRNMNPWVKLCIRVGYFTMALILSL